MKNIITSVGRTVFKTRSVLAVRAPGLEPQQPKNIGVERQHPKNTGLDTGVIGEKQAQGSKTTPQQSSEAPRSWEEEKARIGFNSDKHEMPWVAQAKKHPLNEKDITGGKKFHGSSMAQEPTKLDSSNLGKNLQRDQKLGTKSKVSQAKNFVKNQSTTQQSKSFTDTAKAAASEIKEEATSLKNQAADKLSQATEFVKKQASPSQEFKATQAEDSHGLFDTLKESATNAVGWVKDKFTGETAQHQNINQTFKAGEEAKDRVATKLASETTTSENTVTGQAQPKVNKGVKSDIEKIIEKGTKN